jgi:hypothetical protein
MARDVSIRLDRCQYCNRPGFVVWDADLFTCGHEMCETLAFAEVRRRHHDGASAPEKRLSRALLAAWDLFEYTVRLDERGEVLMPKEADAISEHERQQTAHLLAEIRGLARRYPPARPDPMSRRRVLSRPTRRTRLDARPSAPPAPPRASQPARGTASS